MSDNNQNQANEQALMLGSAQAKSNHTNHPDAQWFPKAGLGLFVHWGLASVHGDLDLSWSMIANTTWDASAQGRNKVTPNEYWSFADRFNPDKYDPDKWLAAAAKAGFKYAVLTAMHHDGYTLWPSKVGDFGVQTYLPGKDFVAQFVDACRKHKLKVGLYFSPPDWYFDRQWMSFNYQTFGVSPSSVGANKDFPRFDQDHQSAPFITEPKDQSQLRKQRFHARVKELLNNYGKIDLLWFDGGTHDNEIRDYARQVNPAIVINSRSCDGDYDCTECELPEGGIEGWFETCHCWQDSDIKRSNGNNMDVWGYLKEEQYKSAEWMLDTYKYLRDHGANLLLNVSPRPNGELPEVVYKRLQEITGKL